VIIIMIIIIILLLLYSILFSPNQGPASHFPNGDRHLSSRLP